MQIRAFTLIELIIVVFIISLASFLFVKLPTFSNPKLKITDLYNILYPNGTFYLFDDGSNLVVKDKNYSVNVQITLPEVYEWDFEEFKEKKFGKLKGKQIVFKYSVKNKVGDSFILKCDEGIFVFKPFWIIKEKSMQSAKDRYLLTSYLKENY